MNKKEKEVVFTIRLDDMAEGHIVWNNWLITTETFPIEERGKKNPNALRIYSLKEKLTDKEINRLKAHEKIEEDDPLAKKIDERGPINVLASAVLMDDFFNIYVDGKEKKVEFEKQKKYQ